MVDKRLLEIRKVKKKKKPKFRCQGTWMDRVKNRWRQPKGQQSKLRKKRRGRMSQPSMGFSSPREVRGLHKTGLKTIIVHNVHELAKIDNKTEGIIIAKVGMKNKMEIVKKAQEKNIKILNLGDSKKYLEESNKKLEERKNKKKSIKQQKEEKKVADKKAEKTEEKKDETPKEETKKGDKSEKIKLLEKRQ